MQAYTANISSIDFSTFKIDSINYDIEELSEQIKVFVIHGSRRHTVSRSDLSIKKKAGAKEPDPISLGWLMEQGNRFFNSIFYLGLKESERPKIQEVPEGEIQGIATSEEVCEALYFQYFFIVTRGTYSESPNKAVGPDVPNFLANVMGYKKTPEQYARILATFSLIKIDPSWARAQPLKELGRETIFRFALGVAGYRLFRPFSIYPCRDDSSVEVKRAFKIAHKMATHTASWQIQSMTRDPRVLETYGNLNKNLAGLMTECFTPEQIEEMVNNKMLFSKPTIDPAHKNYLQWSVDYQFDESLNVF